MRDLSKLKDAIKSVLVSMAVEDKLPLDMTQLDMDAVFDEVNKVINPNGKRFYSYSIEEHNGEYEYTHDGFVELEPDTDADLWLEKYVLDFYGGYENNSEKITIMEMNKMSEDELRAFAKEKEVELEDDMDKAEIISELQEKDVAHDEEYYWFHGEIICENNGTEELTAVEYLIKNGYIQ